MARVSKKVSAAQREAENALHRVALFPAKKMDFPCLFPPDDRIVSQFALFRQDFARFVWYILRHRCQTCFPYQRRILL